MPIGVAAAPIRHEPTDARGQVTVLLVSRCIDAPHCQLCVDICQKYRLVRENVIKREKNSIPRRYFWLA